MQPRAGIVIRATVLAGMASASAWAADLDLEPFLLERGREIALARSAAPPDVARDATVRVLTAKGYETVVEGTNGFVCVVERSWAGPGAFSGDPKALLNPRVLAPICYNPPAVETVLPKQLLKTSMVLDGADAGSLRRAIDRGFADGSLKMPSRSAMAYMLSAGQYLGDRAKKGIPHLMLYVPYATNELWGGFRPGSPQAFVLYGAGSPEAVVIVPASRFVELSEVSDVAEAG